MPLPSVRLLTEAVEALLGTAPAGLTTYTSVVDPAPPVDAAGVLTAYAVLHPGAGNDRPNNLAMAVGQLAWSFQVTCSGGDASYCDWAVDTVRGLVTGKTLSVEGTKVGLMLPPLGFSPPILTNLTVKPPRQYVPLQYQVLSVA